MTQVTLTDSPVNDEAWLAWARERLLRYARTDQDRTDVERFGAAMRRAVYAVRLCYAMSGSKGGGAGLEDCK